MKDNLKMTFIMDSEDLYTQMVIITLVLGQMESALVMESQWIEVEELMKDSGNIASIWGNETITKNTNYFYLNFLFLNLFNYNLFNY